MNSKTIIDIARDLRKNQTKEEKIIWREVRGRRLDRKKFLRQHPVVYEEIQGVKHYFIADFYCAEAKLVLERDGKIHDFQKDYDRERDLICKELGLSVLRIKNEEVKNDIHQVMEKIRQFL